MSMVGRSRWRLVAPAVFAVAGVLFVSSAETAQGRDLRSGERGDLAELIRAENERVESLSARVEDLRHQVDTASTRLDDARGRATRARADALAGPAGLRPMTGPGLRVTLDDAPRPADGSAIPGDPAPDDLVVHQQDVQAVVNSLWAGGAEALQLMDQRVISTSAVRCVGNTLILQGRVYSPPYVVTAVGDVDGMRAALGSSRVLQVYQEYVAAFGLVYDVEEFTSVTVPGYEGALDLQFARPVSAGTPSAGTPSAGTPAATAS